MKKVKFYGEIYEKDSKIEHSGKAEEVVTSLLKDLGWETANLRPDKHLRSHKDVPKKLYYGLYSRYCSHNRQRNDGLIDFESQIFKKGVPDILAWKTENGFPISPVLIEVKTQKESARQSQFKWLIENEAFDVALAVVGEFN